MASHVSPKMGFGETLGLIGALIWTAIKTYFSVLAALITRRYPTWGIPMITVTTVLRNKDLTLSFRQMRKVMAPTGQQIVAWCKSAKATHRAVTLTPEGAGIPSFTLHYINCAESDPGPTLYYVHGGGFCFPIVGMGHCAFAVNCGAAAKAKKVVLLEYSLGPEQKYPIYLLQAIAGLRHLLKTTPASEMIIGGDSAGGNIVLGLLAHMISPHALAAPLDLQGQQLRAALLISPWAKFDCHSASYAANQKVDYLNEEILAPLVEWAEPSTTEIWSEMIRGGAEFWARKPVKKIMCTAGELEVFRDDVIEVAQRLGWSEEAPAQGDVRLFVAPKEVHVQCVLEAGIRRHKGLKMIGMTGKQGASATAVYNWLGAL